jgi:hypothetical protein
VTLGHLLAGQALQLGGQALVRVIQGGRAPTANDETASPAPSADSTGRDTSPAARNS